MHWHNYYNKQPLSLPKQQEIQMTWRVSHARQSFKQMFHNNNWRSLIKTLTNIVHEQRLTNSIIQALGIVTIIDLCFLMFISPSCCTGHTIRAIHYWAPHFSISLAFNSIQKMNEQFNSRSLIDLTCLQNITCSCRYIIVRTYLTWGSTPSRHESMFRWIQ